MYKDRIVSALPTIGSGQDRSDLASLTRGRGRDLISNNTVVFPKEGQTRFAGQGSRSNKFAIFWTADNMNSLFFGPRGVPKKARVTHYVVFLWEYYGM
jgi:hypothetical protein